jgi:CubicO group peptidase (beta-lactamase class C family)
MKITRFMRSQLLLLVVSCSALVAAPQKLDDGLSVATPSVQDFDFEQLAAVVAQIESKQFKAVEAILIAKDNQLVIEQYFNGWRASQAHPLRSAGKVLVSSAIGLIIDQGLLEGVDVKVGAILENTFEGFENPDPRKREVSLKHILTMSDGLDCGPILDPLDPCGERLFRKKYPAKALFDRPLKNAPGEQFSYTDAAPTVAMLLVTGLTKIPYEQYLEENLFKPMNFRFSSNAERLVARDFLKLGLLYANDGQWQGKQIISKNWVNAATDMQYSFNNKSTFAKGYGYYWWITEFAHNDHRHDAYMAAGNGGQYTIVVEDLDLVVTLFGNYYFEQTEDKQQAANQPIAIMQNIVNAVKD